MRAIFITVMLVASFSGHAEIYKCKGTDGSVSYSELPCPGSGKAIIAKPANSRQKTPSLPPPEKVSFSGEKSSDILKSSAILDNIRLLGRDCEWALKVDKRKMSSCLAFMGKLQPDGEYVQVTGRVSEIVKDKSTASEFISELRMIVQSTKDIVRYKEFMLANLGIK